MSLPPRPLAFVLAASNHGTMIVNRHDQRLLADGTGYGVGYQVLNRSCFDPEEVQLALQLLDCRRRTAGDGLVALDGGANIGVHTIEWARHMHGWGRVLAFEAQEVVFYALAGNIAINNCLNARARLAALGAEPGVLPVPQPDYLRDGTFGSLELKPRAAGTEFIGQPVSYQPADCVPVPLVSIDSLQLERLDFAKLDVEGMEVDVLRGARETLRRHRPILLVEAIKADPQALRELLLQAGYGTLIAVGLNWLALHDEDPARAAVSVSGNELTVRPG